MICGVRGDKIGQREQYMLERCEVSGRRATIPLQEWEPFDVTDHLCSIVLLQRHDAEGNVFENLHQDPSQAKHQYWPKSGVFRHADDDFHTGFGHGLHGDAFQAGLWSVLGDAAA